MLVLETKDEFLDAVWNIGHQQDAVFNTKTIREKIPNMCKSSVYARMNILKQQQVITKSNDQKRHVAFKLNVGRFQEVYGMVKTYG